MGQDGPVALRVEIPGTRPHPTNAVTTPDVSKVPALGRGCASAAAASAGGSIQIDGFTE